MKTRRFSISQVLFAGLLAASVASYGQIAAPTTALATPAAAAPAAVAPSNAAVTIKAAAAKTATPPAKAAVVSTASPAPLPPAVTPQAALPKAGIGAACDLTKTLAQMDAASAKFQTAQADFSWDQFQSVVQEHDTQSGVVYFSRHGTTTSMALDIRQPAAKYLTFDGTELSLYTPALNQETIMAAGNNKDQAETFLTLGFGGSGKDLQKTWDVTCVGNEVVDKVPTVKLELVAKQASVRNTFSKVTIWVDPTRAISLKQVFNEPSGDSRTDIFTNIKYNGSINASVFKVKTKAGVQITRK